jgi:hypothetical protein
MHTASGSSHNTSPTLNVEQVFRPAIQADTRWAAAALGCTTSPSGEVLSSESFLKNFSVERSECFSMDQRR